MLKIFIDVCYTHSQALVVPQLEFIVSECEQIFASRVAALPQAVPRLPPDQGLAVVVYTFDLLFSSETDDGSDNLFHQLNIVLRQRDPAKMKHLKPYLAFLMRGLGALPPVEATVFRGLPGTPETVQMIRTHYTIGKDIHWSSFSSTTLDIAKAKRFAAGPGGILFRIAISSGRSVTAYSAHPDEAEILLSPNTKLVVCKACAEDTDGYFYVDLVERKDDKFVF